MYKKKKRKNKVPLPLCKSALSLLKGAGAPILFFHTNSQTKTVKNSSGVIMLPRSLTIICLEVSLFGLT